MRAIKPAVQELFEVALHLKTVGHGKTGNLSVNVLRRLDLVTEPAGDGTQSLRLKPFWAAVIAGLHPKSHDRHYDERLEKWRREWPESRPEMERWIRTWAGRNRNFQKSRWTERVKLETLDGDALFMHRMMDPYRSISIPSIAWGLAHMERRVMTADDLDRARGAMDALRASGLAVVARKDSDEWPQDQVLWVSRPVSQLSMITETDPDVIAREKDIHAFIHWRRRVIDLFHEGWTRSREPVDLPADDRLASIHARFAAEALAAHPDPLICMRKVLKKAADTRTLEDLMALTPEWKDILDRNMRTWFRRHAAENSLDAAVREINLAQARMGMVIALLRIAGYAEGEGPDPAIVLGN